MSVRWTDELATAHEMRISKDKVVESAGAVDRENPLHNDIADELKRLRWYYVHSRTDKRTTTQLGVTDFIIAVPGGKTLWCEAKRKGGKLSKEQNITRYILNATGHWHGVVYCMDDFRALLDAAKN